VCTICYLCAMYSMKSVGRSWYQIACVALNCILFIDYYYYAFVMLYRKVVFSAGIEGLFNAFNKNNTAI